MSEFKVHHSVSELMSLLGVKSGEVGAEVYTDMLLKNMTPYVTTQVSAHNAKRKIAEHTQSPEEFLQKYDELKAKNIRDLDSLVFLLSKLSDDEKTKSFLEKNALDRAAASGTTLSSHSNVLSQLPASGSKITQEELSQLRDKLLREASSTASHVGSDVLRKVMRDKHATRNVQLPPQPDWLFQRPHLTLDFVVGSQGQGDGNVVSLGTLPAALQEQAVIEDLFFCMEGIEGKYIHALTLKDRYGPREFTIDQSLDPSLRELVRRILPTCSNYSTVIRFVEVTPYHLQQTLGSSRLLHSQWNEPLSRHLPTPFLRDKISPTPSLHLMGELTLQKYWFYIQPTMRTLEILASVANAVNKGECIGGAVLSLLHEKTSSLIGDVKGQELCLYLTQAACVPYLEILEKWIYKGIVCDPYAEFLVEENETMSKEKLQEDFNDAYWDQHYSIRRERIPVFLEQVADKILNTGKYLNVVRLCGRDVKCPNAEEIVYTIKERQYVEHIERAYAFASKVLLELLMEEKELMGRLRSLKHYFLLDQGDFIGQLMDMTEEELKKTIDEIMPGRLETLLELALRTSTANADPYKDDLRVDLLPYDLITQMFKILTIDTKLEKDYRVDPVDLRLSGLEAFSFDYMVKWPVTLVLNRKSLTRYQMLFRHLFYCKHVERQLCNVWVSNKAAKMFTLQSTRWYAAAFALRQRMLNFVQNFMYYMMFEVVEPNWHDFEQNMNDVTTIDDVLAFHNDFLNSCLNDCMLTNPDLLKIVHKLMMVCVTYCNFMQRVTKTTDVDLEMSKLNFESTLQAAPTAKQRKQEPSFKKTTAKVVSEHVDQLTSSENFERTISKFDSNFSKLLVELLDKTMDYSTANCEHKLMNILYRLDFNGFYTEQLEAVAQERSMIEAAPPESEPGSSHSRPRSGRSTASST
ncbi:gamma-tubulin complex component 2 [Lingula anatina]|uniref:Gamma-tubulin complex component n=1 Tax=Lingula anatina TaxID=7574 RepID=A0A1S3JMB7_LINAN|nr:gamma-tubulin complex component 2 [Lingula anatina]|eukprot:XP_013411271.1 gamma-tubulin complex component 2 [Lingula anatina]